MLQLVVWIYLKTFAQSNQQTQVSPSQRGHVPQTEVHAAAYRACDHAGGHAAAQTVKRLYGGGLHDGCVMDVM